MEEYPIVSSNPEVQKRYIGMRLDGQSHSIAEILATRSFPALRTDSEFNKGKANGSQFEDHPGLGEYYKQVAESHGVNVTGKTYISGLARYPGDPEAWVNGRGDVERICRERGWACSGAGVEIEMQDREPAPDIPIAPDLVEEEVQKVMALDPGYKVEDVREEMAALLSGQIDPAAEDISGITDYEVRESYERTLQNVQG